MKAAQPMTTPENIADVMKRYGDWSAWAAKQKADGFEGLLIPYEGATEDAVDIANHFCPVLPKVREALEAADKWFDGWCPSATCCASSGLKVHLQIREMLKLLNGKAQP